VWRLAHALAGAATPHDVALAVTGHGAAAGSAAVATMALFDRSTGRLSVSSSADLDPSIASRWSELDLGIDTPLGHAITSAAPVLLPSLESIGSAYPAVHDDAVAAGLGAAASWPLRQAGGAILGAVGLGWREPQPFDPPQRLGLSLIADLTAQALDRATLYAERLEGADRIRLLQQVTSKLATATTTEMIFRVIVDEGITMIGDYGGVCVGDPRDHRRVIGWFTPGFSKELEGEFSLPLDDPMALITAFRTDALVIARTNAEAIALSPTNAAAHREHHSHGILGVPAHANGVAVGAIGMGFTAEGKVTEETVGISRTLADLMGQALYRASLYEQSRTVANSLQVSLLPRVPEVPGFEASARYAPGGAVGGDGEIVVGGDWYEVIDLGTGRLGIVIGDVMGRGIGAAAVMGQLRALALGYAQLDLQPGRILELLDTLLTTLANDQIATCFSAVYDRGSGRLTFASAGHLMPIVMVPGAPPTSLVGATGPPLGTDRRHYVDQTIALPTGSLLAAFTDGLVEVRNLSLEAGISQLSDYLGGHRHLPLPELAERALAHMATFRSPDDDTALLLVRARPEP
jgi:GAF domain-containing protein